MFLEQILMLSLDTLFRADRQPGGKNGELCDRAHNQPSNNTGRNTRVRTYDTICLILATLPGSFYIKQASDVAAIYLPDAT